MGRFWDTSAIVPLLVDEPASAAMRALAEEDPGMVVWWGTRVECVSALARQRRDGTMAATVGRDAQRVLAALVRSWSEVAPTDTLRKRAEQLVTLHPLRAADALQLAAALVWCRDDPPAHGIVSLHDRLREASTLQGMQVLPGG